MPPDGQAHLWLYSKKQYEQRVFGPVLSVRHGSNLRLVTGYFHFVPKPHIVNGAFDPGTLQLEAIEASVPDTNRLSLAEAIRQHNVEEARRIIHAGAKLNVWDEDSSLPLIQAIRFGKTGLAEELLEAGADPNIEGYEGDTALGQAAWYCNLKIAKELLSRGARVNVAATNGDTPLMGAAQTCKDGEMVKLLLQAGADPNGKTPQNVTTTLMCAEGNPLNVAELLKAGADPTVRSSYGNTAESDNCDRGDAGHTQACNLIREAIKTASEHSPN